MKKLYSSLAGFLLLLIFFTGCSRMVPLPQNNYVQDFHTGDLRKKLKPYPKSSIPYQNILNKDIANVQEGDTNLYGIQVTKDLKTAYDGYLSGDGEKALTALKHIAQTSDNDKMLWQASFLKVQTLIMMGLGDDALDEISTCRKYEEKSFHSNLNCTSLKGELEVWLEDYDAAKKDASDVLLTIGDWEFPTSYERPPANMDRLVAITTAQMRAYTTLAALYNLTEDYTNSYYYANEAEKRINAVHYVSNHWLYGKFVHLHLDSYYGRASNLTFLATAELALGKNPHKTAQDFQKAIDFFNMIHYKKGVATVLALKARVYNKIGRHDMCYTAGKEAIDYALKYGFLDFVWRVEVLRAQTLQHLGKFLEAEAAFRRADDTVNILSGALSSDSSKTRFGVGKDDIAYNLIQFDIAKKDYSQLFVDLEKNRARAFVDILSSRLIDMQRNNKTLKSIALLDKQIKKQELLNSSNPTRESVENLNSLLKQREDEAKILQEESPKLSTAVSIWSSTLKQTQASLKKDQSMIYFLPFRADEKISYLKITKDNVTLQHLAISENELRNDLAKLSDMLGIKTLLATRGLKLKEASYVSSEKLQNKHEIERFILKLSKKLSVKNIFNSDKTYIVASGITNFIPWGMLDTDDKFTQLPNGSWINFKDIRLQPKKEMLVIANPDFGGELPQLAGAQKEGESIARLYNAPLLKGKDATKLNLEKQLSGGVDILHFATHSIFYKNDPLGSSIYLSDNGKAYPLSAKEIFENPLRANLVVLSSCESGLGRSISGDDMLGLSRSFFLGGAKSVLSSLWEIDDEGSKEFMNVFYKYALKGDYSLAYQKARENLKNRGYSPAIYGAFILNGTH